ncbi:MAG: methyltransferase domain-containing protein [Methanomicrobiales archaeon]|nr:methyltransferase domain-containing protein [Methanomicrobiales archaeon]NYT20224.1 methyltransferase domain-containing protein [Methanomicrobiales archaeon]
MTLPGGPTKDEIMAISLQKLGLRRGDVLVDIGCGTGKVAVHAAPFVQQVYAADIRDEAVRCTREEAARCGITNIEVSREHGADLIMRLPHIDCAFVGGSRDLSRMLTLLAGKKVRSVVVNAVLISTLHEAVSAMEELGIFREAVHVMVSRSSPLGSGLMFRPLDPVFIIAGGAPC